MENIQFELLLTPFNGMHSGINLNDVKNIYSAQAVSIKRIVEFTPQNNASNPAHPFGYIQMLYNQSTNQNPIQLELSLPKNQDFTVVLSVETNVENSVFLFTIDGTIQTKIAKKGSNTINVTFKGNSTGIYNLIINPEYKMDCTTFILSEIKIYTPV